VRWFSGNIWFLSFSHDPIFFGNSPPESQICMSRTGDISQRHGTFNALYSVLQINTLHPGEYHSHFESRVAVDVSLPTSTARWNRRGRHGRVDRPSVMWQLIKGGVPSSLHTRSAQMIPSGARTSSPRPRSRCAISARYLDLANHTVSSPNRTCLQGTVPTHGREERGQRTLHSISRPISPFHSTAA
jgi:hypothetical protein